MRLVAIFEDGELELIDYLWENRHMKYALWGNIPPHLSTKVSREFTNGLYGGVKAPYLCVTKSDYLAAIKQDMVRILRVE